jgi:carbonic anhydrase
MVGISQSPIDLGLALPGDSGSLLFGYDEHPVEGHDAGTTLEFTVPSGSGIECRTTRYELVEFHFHTPSEHAIRGAYAAIEIHLVHEAADGELLVVGVFGVEGESGRWPTRLTEPLHLDWLLPVSTAHYLYSGSLTTPPYTEGVEWRVLTKRITINTEWVSRFRAAYAPNNRALQPLNARTITLGYHTYPDARPAFSGTPRGESPQPFWRT